MIWRRAFSTAGTALLVVGLLITAAAAPALADWLGIGTAFAATAGAAWKIVAINAIVAAQTTILTAIVAVGLIILAGRFTDLAKSAFRDNQVTVPEQVVLAGVGLLDTVVVAFLLRIGWYVLRRLT